MISTKLRIAALIIVASALLRRGYNQQTAVAPATQVRQLRGLHIRRATVSV
jgi:hypothetical protein